MKANYIDSVQKQFQYYKILGEKTFEQLTDEQLIYQFNADSNSIEMIVNHLIGNMLSRWTQFLTTDGEKEWRNRDAEFSSINHETTLFSRSEFHNKWEKGWICLFKAIEECRQIDLESIVFIRNTGHTVLEAINRQLAHYSYHVGQIVYIGKILKSEEWTSLSIPKNQSDIYNKEKFKQIKQRGHFTDEFLGEG